MILIVRVGWELILPGSVSLLLRHHILSHILYCVCTNSNVTASAAVSALESSLHMNSFPRLSPGVGKGLVGVNQVGEDILTACINETLSGNNSQSDIVGNESCLYHLLPI